MTIIKLNWIKFKRSPLLHKELSGLILMGIPFLYFAIASILIGPLLIYHFSDNDLYDDLYILNNLGHIILYYFLADLILRFILQKFSLLDIKKYLLTPIAKSKLAKHILYKSLSHYFNVFPFLFALSFSISISFEIGTNQGFICFVLLLGLILLNNFLAFALSSRFQARPKLVIGIILLLSAILFVDYKNYIQISPILITIWTYLISSSWAYLLPLFFALISIYTGHEFLIKNLYLDEINSENSKTKGAYNFNLLWLNNYGKIGQLINLELKLILRNRRSRNILWLSAIMLVYPLIFLGEGKEHFILFVSILVPGMFAMNYGQLFFAWNGSYFDLLLSRNIKLEDLFRAKYYLLALSCFLFMTLSLPYGFLDNKYFIYFPILTIFTIGVTIYLYMFIGCFKSKRIDVQKKATMNYEGMTITHFLIMIPIILIPYTIIYVAEFFNSEWLGLSVLLAIGTLGIIFHRTITKLIVNTFMKKRHIIAHTFRKEN